MAELMYMIATILILPALIFGMWASINVTSTFNRYSGVSSAMGITGAALARRLLDQNGCGHVNVEQSRGHLSDHYDPRTKMVRLSPDVFNGTSLAALGVAAHEVGHAIQDHTNYPPLKIRQLVIKTTSLVNKALLPLIIIGLVLSIVATSANGDIWHYVLIGLCAMYGLSFLINVITLPTEYDASNRAKKMLQNGILYDEAEYTAVSGVLRAAALTYVAALVSSLAFFLRFLALVLLTRKR